MMTVGLDNIDSRLAQLVTATSGLVEGLSEIKETAKEQNRTAEPVLGDFLEIQETIRAQSRVAEWQQQSIEKFASIIAEQARTIAELTQTARDSLEASRTAAQAAQSAAVIAQRIKTLFAI